MMDKDKIINLAKKLGLVNDGNGDIVDVARKIGINNYSGSSSDDARVFESLNDLLDYYNQTGKLPAGVVIDLPVGFDVEVDGVFPESLDVEGYPDNSSRDLDNAKSLDKSQKGADVDEPGLSSLDQHDNDEKSSESENRDNEGQNDEDEDSQSHDESNDNNEDVDSQSQDDSNRGEETSDSRKADKQDQNSEDEKEQKGNEQDQNGESSDSQKSDDQGQNDESSESQNNNEQSQSEDSLDSKKDNEQNQNGESSERQNSDKQDENNKNKDQNNDSSSNKNNGDDSQTSNSNKQKTDNQNQSKQSDANGTNNNKSSNNKNQTKPNAAQNSNENKKNAFNNKNNNKSQDPTQNARKTANQNKKVIGGNKEPASNVTKPKNNIISKVSDAKKNIASNAKKKTADLGKKAAKGAAKAAKAVGKAIVKAAKAIISFIISHPYVAIIIFVVLLVIFLLLMILFAVGGGDGKGGLSNKSCSYNLNGVVTTGEINLVNLKVELINCNGTKDNYTVLENVNFEKYIVGVALAEMGNESPDEALKAQIIAVKNFSLTRNKSMCPNSQDDCFFGYNPNDQVVRLRACEKDQVYWDFEKDIYRQERSGDSAVYTPEINPEDGTLWKKALPASRVRQLNELASSIQGKVLLDSEGNVLHTDYASQITETFRTKAQEGYTYDQILADVYGSNNYSENGCYSSGVVDYGEYSLSSEGHVILHEPLGGFLQKQGTSLDEFNALIAANVDKAGWGTRAGVVAAAVTLIGELGDRYGVKVPYYWGGGHYDGVVDGALEYWGANKCHTYANNQNYDYCGFDCSGFVPWAIRNGGFDKKQDLAGRFKKMKGAKVVLLRDQALLAPGDLLESPHHIVLVVGVDESTHQYICAEAAGNQYGVLFTRRSFNERGYYGVDMDGYYNNPENVRSPIR